MTGFGDVNVGDKVRLTAENGAEHVTVIDEVAENGSCIRDEMHGWYYPQYWSVEVLEHAPKPLPDVDGVYMPANQSVTSGPNLFWRHNGKWDGESSAQYHQKAAGLIALVPESDVEEARAAVVKEIVEWAREEWPGLRFAVSTSIAERFGGKA